MGVLLRGNDLISYCFSNSLIRVSGEARDEGFANGGGIIGFTSNTDGRRIEKDFVITRIIPEYDVGYGCYGGICGFWGNEGSIKDCYVGDITVDGLGGANGGICGRVSPTLGSDGFRCSNCSYYSLGISQYCAIEGFDENVKKVDNKNELPRIIDVVGNQFKELPSGSVALNWQ